jgi:DNA sulfur modification protein DndD
MILTKLTLHNFGIYAGRHEVDITPKPDRPIILIGALNGAGKTTLLEGIQFALFGKFAKFLSKNKSAYIEFLINSVNRRNAERSASVSVEFFTKNRGKHQLFEVVRTWSLKSHGASADSVQVFKNGELDLELSERWPELSETFFPSQLSDLFFFDGERIESLAQPARCSELIRTGLNSLLGLDLVTDLAKTLQILDRKLKVDGISEEHKEKIIRLNTKVAVLTDQQQNLEQEMVVILGALSDLQLNLESFRSQLRQQGGDLFEKRDLLIQRQNELLNLISSKRLELTELAASNLPLTLLEGMLKQLEALAKKGLTIDQKEVVNDALTSFSVNVINELSGRTEFSSEQVEFLEKIHIALIQIQNVDDSRPEINFSKESIRSVRTEGTLNRTKGLRQILELGKFQSELDQIERQLLAVPDAVKLEPLFIDIKKTEDGIRHYESKRGGLQDQIERIKRELDSTSKHFEIASSEVRKNEAEEMLLKNMHQQLIRGKEVLVKFEQKIRNKHITNLEKLICESFKVLLRKKSFVNSISICQNTFMLTIQIIGEGDVPASKLSAGERQLLAVAVLWALAKASGRKLPTVIDTPLGRLDSVHRKSFVQNYFPFAGDQVILLSTDEEIVGSYHRTLKQHTSHQYLIEYDDKKQSSEIVKGYFESTKEPA